jgi:hypothetical protein
MKVLLSLIVRCLVSSVKNELSRAFAGEFLKKSIFLL